MAGPLSPKTERIADGVWRVAGDLRQGMNVYLLEDGDGLTMFDAGTKGMTKPLRREVERLGGLKRIVLGHSHTDHRGAAPGLAKQLGVPVFCHPDEVSDAEGDGGLHYFRYDKVEVAWVRWIYPTLLKRIWDGGPVKIADTVSEGDEVAGFKVVHFPGHAPGLIGLWRESDRLAIVSDTFYVADASHLKPRLTEIGPEGKERLKPTVPHPFATQDHDLARQSLRKLAALEPATAWAGHGGSVSGEPAEVRERLERGAEAEFPRP